MIYSLHRSTSAYTRVTSCGCEYHLVVFNLQYEGVLILSCTLDSAIGNMILAFFNMQSRLRNLWNLSI